MKRLGFGFMRLPLLDQNDQTSFDYDILNELVDTFLEKGFTYFDTALTYHNFKSEEALRKSLIERHERDEFVFATKLAPRLLKKEGDQERIFNEQLNNCGVDYFDYYLIHNLGHDAYESAKKFGTFEYMLNQKKEGKIKNVGFSFHDTPELLEQILKDNPNIDFVQLQLNYIDWENPGIQSRRCYEIARKYNKPIVVMEPCKGGNLVNIPDEAKKLMKNYDNKASPASWAIRYVASLDGVIMVLSGMNTLEQILDNVSYMDKFKPLNEEEHEIIDKVTDIINKDTAIQCTACNYCLNNCPQNIKIPDYFALYNSSERATTDNVSSQFVYYQNLTADFGKASSCIECGQCEKVCPQHIKIIDKLKKVADTFENVSLPGSD